MVPENGIQTAQLVITLDVNLFQPHSECARASSIGQAGAEGAGPAGEALDLRGGVGRDVYPACVRGDREGSSALGSLLGFPGLPLLQRSPALQTPPHALKAL